MERRYTKPTLKKYKLVKTEDGNVIIWEENTTENVSVLLHKEQRFIQTRDLRDKEKCLQLAAELPAEEKVKGSFTEAFKAAKKIVGPENVFIPIRADQNKY